MDLLWGVYRVRVQGLRCTLKILHDLMTLPTLNFGNYDTIVF